MSSTDYSQRFLFEALDIRGEFVHLENSYQAVLSNGEYPEVIQHLLGELVCASVLLSSILKYEGRLAIHAQSEGPVSLLVAECSDKKGIRAIAHFDEQSVAGLDKSMPLSALISGGQLAIMIQPTTGKQYQGIVPLSGKTLAECLERYFEQSEQLPTRIYLAADQRKAGGLLLQQLPKSQDALSEEARNQWEHITTLADTTRSQELTELPAETLLNRLFVEDAIRAFEAQNVSFQCRCSKEKTRFALSVMEKHELEEILEKKQCITVDCQFCTTRYEFTRDDLKLLEKTAAPNNQTGALH